MNFQLSKLYAITDVSLSGLSHVEQVAAMCAGGARLVQLRDKDLSPQEFYQQAREALEITRRSKARLIINDRVDIALSIGADGVHLGQDDMPPDAARRVLGADAIIGWSTHNVEQAISGRELPINYLALGPIFGTGTKKNPDPEVGLDRLREVCRQVSDIPLVAIGGITLENAPSVLAEGADSVAIVSWLVSPGHSIQSRTRQFLAAV